MAVLEANRVADSGGATLTVPPGTLIFHCANSAPSGFLKANGATISRTTYAALFAAIGTTFGAGNGSTTFTLPDMRGEFPRGWDDGRGVDSGRTFGSFQLGTGHYWTNGGFTIQGDEHMVNFESLFNISAFNTITVSGTLNIQQNRTWARTRPRNIALLACIKF